MLAHGSMFLLPVFCCLVLYASNGHGARILGFVHMPAYSHYALGNRIFEELAARGHEVTLVSAFPRKTPTKNLKDIYLDGALAQMEERNLFEMGGMNKFLMLLWFDMMGANLTDFVIGHPNVQKLIKSNQQFDLVLVEQFANEAMHGFAYHYKCPIILLSTIGSSRWTNHKVGNPTNPAYMTELFLSFSVPMTFFQRLYNTLYFVTGTLLHRFYSMPKHDEILHKYFPDAPNIYDLYYNASLVLLNSDVSTNQPVPRVPNMIDIGGFHVYPPKPLPKDIKDFMDSAKHGVIYFSMGSNLKSKQIHPENLQALLNIFGKLKQKVLWKWEADSLPGQPANVKVGKWLPQQDILAHPNLVLFITHGGLLSTIEAVYHGVPLVTIPVFGDQEINAALTKNAGYSINMAYRDFKEQTLESAVNEILNNPKYKDNVKLRSRIMHDQQTKPLDRAMFWIEYVMKFGGAPHLQNIAPTLPWYQYLLLDVMAFIGAILLVFTTLLYLLFVKCCCKKKAAKVPLSKKIK